MYVCMHHDNCIYESEALMQQATELASASRLRGERLAAECSAILEGLQAGVWVGFRV